MARVAKKESTRASSDSAADFGFEAVEKAEGRSASGEVKKSRQFVIRNSAFVIFPVPPKGNANFARVQHFIHHLAPQGMAGFVLANPWP